MARITFKKIRLEYAGEDLLNGGTFADANGALNGNTRYTTQAVAHLGADAVELDESGNIERECSIPVTVDYENETEMIEDVLARQDFADEHQRGVLRYVVDRAVDAKAVLTPLESYNSSMAYEFAVMENGVEVNSWAWNAQDGDTVQELLAALNDDSGQYWMNTRDIEAMLEDGKVVLRRIGVHGAASNGYVIQPWANTPFEETEETPISGGADVTEYAYTAGLANFEYASMDTARMRVVYTYSFIVSGKVRE